MRFALIGNPNCGKTTLFNALTGSTAHVGNWPGVTVERKEGVYKKLPEPVDIVDLPGIYSLSPYTPEEIVARNYIIDETPDLVINILDVTNFERNLYLTTQVLETDCPVIVALNMVDVFEREGGKVDLRMLRRLLGVPVVLISALRKGGLEPLMQEAYKTATLARKGVSILGESDFAPQFNDIMELIEKKAPDLKHPVFHAAKFLEKDRLETHLEPDDEALVHKMRANIPLKPVFEGDLEAAVADARYRYISQRLASAVSKPSKEYNATASARIDRVLTGKYTGIPAFIFFIFLVFHLTLGSNLFFCTGIPSPGVLLSNLVASFFGFVTDQVRTFFVTLSAPAWVTGALVDGVLSGVGTVLSFLPQILILFLSLSILEDSGYMARAAFITDRLFKRFGLSGRSFLPLLMGFGCSVPAMLATRTLENDKNRRITLMILPFFSCGAKMPIWVLFAAAFFPAHSDIAVFAMYFLGVLTAIFAAAILNRTVFKKTFTPFIMELPDYRLPRLKNLAINLWEKLRSFVLRVTTVVSVATVVVWFLSNYTFAFTAAGSIDASMIGALGRTLRPIFVPLGFGAGSFGSGAVIAVLTGLLGKETVVATLGVLLSAASDASLTTAVAAAFSLPAALAFMCFNLLSLPCLAAVATMWREMKSRRYAVFTIGFWFAAAWIVSFAVHTVASLF